MYTGRGVSAAAGGREGRIIKIVLIEGREELTQEKLNHEETELECGRKYVHEKARD